MIMMYILWVKGHINTVWGHCLVHCVRYGTYKSLSFLQIQSHMFQSDPNVCTCSFYFKSAV